MEDLEEIYELRALLEERAARHALRSLDDEALAGIEQAAAECVQAAERGDFAAELAANRRLHFGIVDAPDRPHALRVIRLLWDSTEAYRAMYYNSPVERHESVAAHERILEALREHDADRLVAELGAHRTRALDVLGAILAA
jgi:DNA-binding GntR family transcriptional regulator